MKSPTVTVIMTVYNAERFLKESILSVINQTLKNLELIIIDDCSTDNSLILIKKYAKKDNRIIVIVNKENLGPAVSRNIGIKIAKGKYIAILDADDIALPERLKTQCEFLNINVDIFLVGSGWFVIDEKSKITNRKTLSITKPEDIKKQIINNNCIHNPTVMFRNDKQTFYRSKFRFAQDYDLWFNLLSQRKLLQNIPDPLIKYRHVSNSISFLNKGKQRLFMEKAKIFYFQRLEDGKDDYDEFDPKEIISIDIETTSNIIMIESEIKASFKLNNFSRTRRFCVKYFRNFGFINKMVVYYLISFLGVRAIDSIRKIIN